MSILIIALSSFIDPLGNAPGILFLFLAIPFTLFAVRPTGLSRIVFLGFLLLGTMILSSRSLFDPDDPSLMIETADIIRSVISWLPLLAISIYAFFVVPQFSPKQENSIYPHRLIFLCAGLFFLGGAIIDLFLLDRPIPGRSDLIAATAPLLFALWPTRVSIFLLAVQPIYAAVDRSISALMHPMAQEIFGMGQLLLVSAASFAMLVAQLTYLLLVWTAFLESNHRRLVNDA